MIRILIGEPVEEMKGPTGQDHESEDYWVCGYKEVEGPKDMPSTSLADTLYHTGKLPDFKARERAMGLRYDEDCTISGEPGPKDLKQ